MSNAPAFISPDDVSPAAPDRLQALRKLVATARDQEAEKAGLEERITTLSKALNTLYSTTLPDLMDEIGIASIALPADGNLPPVTAQLKPYYAANIQAKWPEQQRKAAFDWLDQHGHGDLIKTEVTVLFPREERAEASELLEELRGEGLEPVIKENVSHQTLTAWLKEQVERSGILPPLELLGATVGRIVRLSTPKE